MADFVSWAAEYTKMLNDYSNRDHLLHSYRTPDGTFVQYKTDKEFFEALALVKDKMDNDSASSGSASRRACATSRGETW